VSPGGNDGTECTYDEPCRPIRRALEKAEPGDVLIISGGTYTGTVEVTKTVTLEGGYFHICLPDCTWFRLSCDPSFTILDGLHAGRVMSVSSGVAITINCLTIANGDAAGLGGEIFAGSDAGGGVYAYRPAQLFISNAVITNNTATASGAGGGLYVYGGSLTLSNTQVVSNFAQLGGGLYLYDADSLEIRGSEFSQNKAWGAWGGGAFIGRTGNGEIAASSFLTNSAGYGGGVFFSLYSDLTVTGNTFRGNSVGASGGGIYMNHSSPRIVSNTIVSNTASQGGGIAVLGEHPRISGNVISDNKAGQGGGLYLELSEDAVIEGNLISHNDATGSCGGGVYLKDSSGHLHNNFLVSNDAFSSGAAVCADGGETRMIHNTLVWNGSSGWTSGDGAYLFNGATAALTNTILVGHHSAIYASGGTTATLQATLWGSGTWANDADWEGAGTILTRTVNLWADPSFLDPAVGDFHLAAGSAAIGQGVDTGVVTDFDGEPRIGAPDLGADEYVAYTYLPLAVRKH